MAANALEYITIKGFKSCGSTPIWNWWRPYGGRGIAADGEESRRCGDFAPQAVIAQPDLGGPNFDGLIDGTHARGLAFDLEGLRSVVGGASEGSGKWHGGRAVREFEIDGDGDSIDFIFA